MSQLLAVLPQGVVFPTASNQTLYPRFGRSRLKLLQQCIGNEARQPKCHIFWSSFQGVSLGFHHKAYVCDEAQSEYFTDIIRDKVEPGVFPEIQTLKKFPKEELSAKVVLLRFDSNILLKAELDGSSPSVSSAIYTIKYLLDAGARIKIVTSWNKNFDGKYQSLESVAGALSSLLQRHIVTGQFIGCDMFLKTEALRKADIVLLDNLSEFKEEVSNSVEFAEMLASGVDIYVNDAFSESHKMLASTIAVSSFCTVCMAGFHFEESLSQLKSAVEVGKRPYVAIIGGGNLYDKAAAISSLASRCDALVFVGTMSFQIMHALGHPVPCNFVEPGAHESALDIIKAANVRKIPIWYPKDFWCRNNVFEKQLKLCPADSVLDGWLPVDLGPSSLEEIDSLLVKSKKIIWIGPVKFQFSSQQSNGANKLAEMLYIKSQSNCDITIVGGKACKEIRVKSMSASAFNLIENASVVWNFLRGRTVPGVMALDRIRFAYPFDIDWRSVYHDPMQPLIVDIGSGNGMFILEMARKRKDLNFLGLEINKKLVIRCLDSVHQSAIQNGFFIATNATSSFHTIVSDYPGELVLVSIQCPNPDFNKAEHQRRMLQQSLVGAIADLLATEGKVFLQSDIEAVTLKMKEQFLKYGKGRLVADHLCKGIWLEKNPFEVRSDWEQHVIDRGAPMYRIMLSKSNKSDELMRNPAKGM